MSDVIFGIHPVSEALKSHERRFDYVAVARDRTDPRMQRIVDDCRGQGISVRFVPREEIDRATGTSTHQGVMAMTSRKTFSDLDDLLANRRAEHVFLLVLDGVEDPHNLVHILEAGATAIIQPGGSQRDPEVIEAADRLGLAMLFTGVRHFRH